MYATRTNDALSIAYWPMRRSSIELLTMVGRPVAGMKNAAGFTTGAPLTANGLLAYVPPLTLVFVLAQLKTASPKRSNFPDMSPFQLKPAPSVLMLSCSSAFQPRQGSIL